MTLHESSLRIILRDNFKGGFFMSEKMLVTQALDERDLLVKKISDKIDKASFVDRKCGILCLCKKECVLQIGIL